MKKWIALMLSLVFFFNLASFRPVNAEEYFNDSLVGETLDFDSLDDPAFLQYIEDSVYANLEAEFADSEAVFQIDDVNVTFVSKEYLEETAYNTKANVFFGYTLAQINDAFDGEKYVFTLSDTGDTVVQEFLEIPNDMYNRIITNVLIGTGIILICVTVSVLTAGTATAGTAAVGMAKIHMIFAASAKTAASFAGYGALCSGVTTFAARGFETGWDLDAMTESAVVASSEGFKWGAITGAVTGGAKEALRINRISHGALSPREAEEAAHAYYGGREQVTYLDGQEITYGKLGGVRPDIVVGNEAIEVKCYDLTNPDSLNMLKYTLKTEVSQRVIHLPEGMTQRIVLNVEGRGYYSTKVKQIIEGIRNYLDPVYPDIPIDVMGAML